MNSKKPLRRSGLISPWGIGAIVPFPHDESLMIAGLDMWRYNDSTIDDFLIKDERLQKRLGVKELRWPPDYRDKKSDPKNFNLTIPAVRFPRWNYCPHCGGMEYTGLYTKQPTCSAFPWKHGRKCQSTKKYQHKLIPERFVVVCPEGHISDFPIAEWIHFGSGYKYNPSTCRIRRSTGGTSAALTGVRYECTCGANKSIASAMRKGALAKMGYKCSGSKPWLGIENDIEKPCKCNPEEIKVLQRGASNVWFSETISSINIPTNNGALSRRLISIVDDTYQKVSDSRVNGDLPIDMIKVYSDVYSIDYEELYNAYKTKIENIDNITNIDEKTTEEEYRLAEYKMLIKNSGSDTLDFHCINKKSSEYNTIIQEYFNSISLVKKLRETRAFVGFSRLEPDSSKSISEKKEMLSLGNINWLPAVEVYGEGIFFEFNEEKIKEWAQKEDVKTRINILNKSYRQSTFGKNENEDLRSEYVLLHTFAHLIINQLSFECGYGSSSIRERIYCGKTNDGCGMRGILIYTASGDSEGSLGGLVRRGESGKLENTIISAIKKAEWCSSDPVCIQSSGQGPESCNLAACHNCSLLPETCCENGNRLLDRGLIVGTLDNKKIGFFQKLIENI